MSHQATPQEQISHRKTKVDPGAGWHLTTYQEERAVAIVQYDRDGSPDVVLVPFERVSALSAALLAAALDVTTEGEAL